MGRCCRGGIDVAPFSQELMKQPGGISPGFFCPIVPETHVSSILDQILNNPFPEVICQCHPINLPLSVSLKKCICWKMVPTSFHCSFVIPVQLVSPSMKGYTITVHSSNWVHKAPLLVGTGATTDVIP